MDLSEVIVTRESIERFLRGVKRPRFVEWYDSSALVGIRFIGKTTSMYWKSLEGHYTVISGDLVRLYGVDTRELLGFLKRFDRIAIDEIHLIKDRNELFKALHDHGTRIIATGSSMISILSSTEFARRIKPIKMHTLSSWERFYLETGRFIDLRRRTIEELVSKSSTLGIDLLAALRMHGESKLLYYGGFPASLLITDPLELKASIRNSLQRLIERDLLDIDPNAATILLRCIAEQPSNVYSCFRDHYGKRHRSFIHRILEKLQDSGLVFPIPIGDTGSKNRHRYFTDPAFYLIYGRTDIGELLEAAVAYALWSRGYVVTRPGSRRKTRPDFIVIDRGKRLTLEIKHGNERPVGYDLVIYGGLEIKTGKTTYLPRYLVI